MPAVCRHLILKLYTMRPMGYACIAFKDTKTVHNVLVGVCRLHYTPNLRTINLSLEDRRCDWLTLQKNTQPGCPRSATNPSITQSVLKMVYRNLTMSVRDLSCSLSALFNF